MLESLDELGHYFRMSLKVFVSIKSGLVSLQKRFAFPLGLLRVSLAGCEFVEADID